MEARNTWKITEFELPRVTESCLRFSEIENFHWSGYTTILEQDNIKRSDQDIFDSKTPPLCSDRLLTRGGFHRILDRSSDFEQIWGILDSWCRFPRCTLPKPKNFRAPAARIFLFISALYTFKNLKFSAPAARSKSTTTPLYT